MNQYFNDNSIKVYNFFLGKLKNEYGLSDEVARRTSAAITGNFYHESAGMSPTAVGDSGDAFGIAQWTYGGERRYKLEKVPNYRTLDAQLNFAWREMTSSHKSALDRTIKAPTLEDATHTFNKYYEGSKDGMGRDDNWSIGARRNRLQASYAYAGLNPRDVTREMVMSKNLNKGRGTKTTQPHGYEGEYNPAASTYDVYANMPQIDGMSTEYIENYVPGMADDTFGQMLGAVDEYSLTPHTDGELIARHGIGSYTEEESTTEPKTEEYISPEAAVLQQMNAERDMMLRFAQMRQAKETEEAYIQEMQAQAAQQQVQQRQQVPAFFDYRTLYPGYENLG